MNLYIDYYEMILNQKDSNWFSSTLSTTGLENENDPETSLTFSSIGLFDSNKSNGYLKNGSWHFMLRNYNGGGTIDTLIWSQTAWITDSITTEDGFGADLSMIPNQSLVTSPWDRFYGLGFSDAPQVYLDGSSNVWGSWWNAVGVITPHPYGLPGFHWRGGTGQTLYILNPASNPIFDRIMPFTSDYCNDFYQPNGRIIPKFNTIYGSITIQDYFQMEFDIIIKSHSQIAQWQNVFRIGNNNNERFPGLWIGGSNNAASWTTSYLKNDGLGTSTITPATNGKHHYYIRMTPTELNISIDGQWYNYGGNFDRSNYVGSTANIYFGEDFSHGTHTIADVELSNICMRSMVPTASPTLSPTSPTASPSMAPSNAPTPAPTNNPTQAPTTQPTKSPSYDPTSSPTITAMSANYIFIRQAMNRQNAETYCINQYGTNLASIHNEAENTEAANLCAVTSCWIGANDITNEMGSNPNGWTWSDGSLFDYHSWLPNEPNQTGDEDCVEIVPSFSQWNDASCTTHASPFILCNRHNPTPAPTTQPTKAPSYEPTAAPTITAMSANYILVLSPLNWYDADLHCQMEYGTHLASIHNEAENIEAGGLVTDSPLSQAWIGLNDINNDRGTDTDGWVWNDQSLYNYQLWSIPLNIDPAANCVLTFSWIPYEWLNDDCSRSFHFLCNRYNPTPSPTLQPSMSPSTDPTQSPTTSMPSGSPSKIPTRSPNDDPTSDPSLSPTSAPSFPTFSPTTDPTRNPSDVPSMLVLMMDYLKDCLMEYRMDI